MMACVSKKYLMWFYMVHQMVRCHAAGTVQMLDQKQCLLKKWLSLAALILYTKPIVYRHVDSSSAAWVGVYDSFDLTPGQWVQIQL